VSDPLRAAAALGLRVVVEEFGAAARSIAAEYDPRARAIRVSARLLAAPGDAGGVLAACVAHEIYHHLEFLGRVPRAGSAREREARADAYARRSFALSVDPADVRAALAP